MMTRTYLIITFACGVAALAGTLLRTVLRAAPRSHAFRKATRLARDYEIGGMTSHAAAAGAGRT